MSLFEPIFAALENGAVRYVVVGGMATVLHGYARLTADVDLVVDLKHDEALKAIRALTALGFVARAPINVEDYADAALTTTNVRIASIEDLIQLERLAHRPEDQRDIEALQAIRRSKSDG